MTDLMDMNWRSPEPEDLEMGRLSACGFSSREQFLERYPDGRYRAPVDDADLVEFYLHGMCAPFALALRRRTGWELVGLYSTLDFEDAPFHVLCRSPDGRLADARGVGLDEEAARDGMGGGHYIGLMSEAQALRFLRHPGLHRLAERHLDVLIPDSTPAPAP